MSTERKSQFFGSLNGADTMAAEAAKKLEQLWDEGELRLKPHDIGQIAETIEHIRDSLRLIELRNKEFENIANRKAEAAELETATTQP